MELSELDGPIRQFLIVFRITENKGIIKKREYKQILSRFSEPVFGDFG